MFSKRERQFLKANPPVDVPALTFFKKPLYDLFVTMTKSPHRRQYAIKSHIDDAASIIIVTSTLYLNDTANSIVAEAYVLPSSDAPPLSDVAVKLVVGIEGFKMWEKAMSATIESCRDWDHRPECTSNGSSGFVGWTEEGKAFHMYVWIEKREEQGYNGGHLAYFWSSVFGGIANS